MEQYKYKLPNDDLTVDVYVKDGIVVFTQKDISKLLSLGIKEVGDRIDKMLTDGIISGSDIVTEHTVQAVSCHRLAVDVNYYTLTVVNNLAIDIDKNISDFENWLVTNKL